MEYSLPAFRTDLEIVTRRDKDERREYLVRDPASGKSFVLGEKEYFLCKQLDGNTSLSDVQSRFEVHFNMKIDIKHLEAFVRNLREKGFLSDLWPSPPSAFTLFESLPPEVWRRWKLFSPDKLVTWLAKNLWWCYTRPFVIASIVLFLFAIVVLCNNFNAFLNDLKKLFVPLSIFQVLAVVYTCSNIPQELARGTTSIRCGGRADECGVWLTFDIIPRFYCISRVEDIVWKSKRCLVFFTPTYYSLLTASIGMIIWNTTPPGLGLHLFGLIIVVIGAIDTVIRLNILWPVEAYYILANWFEIPALRRRSIAVAKAWLFRRPMPEPLTRKEMGLFISYGLLTTCATFPVIAVGAYFLGKGLVKYLGGVGALIWLVAVTVKYRRGISAWFKQLGPVQWIIDKNRDPEFKKNRKWIITGAIVLILVFPYPYQTGGSFRFLPVEQMEVHTFVSGEIKEVYVKESNWVTEGQSLALLDEREHQKNYDVTRADLDKALADLRLLEAGPKPEEVEKAQQQLNQAQTHYEYSAREAKRLEELYKGGAVSQEEYENAAKMAAVDEQNVEVAKANLELIKSGARPEEIEAQKAIVRNLETKLKYYEENLSLCKLTAPISGMIVTPYMKEKVGQVLTEDALFCTLQDARTIHAEVLVPEGDITQVRIGARVKVRPWAFPARFFYGQVLLIAPQAEDSPDGKIVRVLTEIPNPQLLLKPDMTGEGKIRAGWKPVIVAFTRPLVRFFMVEVWSWFP
jgi:multidrug resistance efflux pump